MEMKRYSLKVSNDNADKVVDIIEREFSHKISSLVKRIDANIKGETNVNFSSDGETVDSILKATDGMYNRIECITDKYPELGVFRRTRSMRAMAKAQEERLMREIISVAEA